MGLEIVEIFMDIESEFCISIPSDFQMNGFVHELEDLVIKLYSPLGIIKLLKKIPDNGPDGHIDPNVYQGIWASSTFLPSPTGVFKRTKNYSSEMIKSALTMKCNYDSHEKIRQKIKSIIKDRSGFRGEVLSGHHLVRDIGCG